VSRRRSKKGTKKASKKQGASAFKEFSERKEGEAQEEMAAELDFLRRRNKALERKVSSQEAAVRLIIQEVRESLEDQAAPRVPTPPKRAAKDRREVAVLLYSDLQAGALGTGPRETDRFSVARLREMVLGPLLEKTLATVDNRRKDAEVETLQLWSLGDLVDGSGMRSNHAWEVEEDVLAQSMHTVPDLSRDFTLGLLRGFQRIEVTAVSGNHGRSGPKKADPNPARVNWDTVAALTWQEKMRGLADDRVTFNVEQDERVVIVELGQRKALLCHGDNLAAGGGGLMGIPMYGITRGLYKLFGSNIYGPVDYVAFGHFHQTMQGALGDVIWWSNGSPQRGNRFAREIVKSDCRPSQRLLFFDAETGDLRSDHILFLDD